MNNQGALLSENELLEFNSITNNATNPRTHCLYLTFVDLKWVKQWNSMSFNKNDEFDYFYILGKHQDTSEKYHKVIPIPTHNKISCKK